MLSDINFLNFLIKFLEGIPMADFKIIVDYEKNSAWSLSDDHGRLLHATAVGTLAEIGSAMGLGLAEQTKVLDEMVEKLLNLRDHSAQFTPASFSAMDIISGKILPPASLDVSTLASAGFDIYSRTASLSDIDKLVQLQSWIDQTFGAQPTEASKLTFKTPGAITDSWLVLRDVLPILTLPSGDIPTSQSGNVIYNKPFSYEGQSEIFMMVSDSNGAPVKVSISRVDKVFSKISSLKLYQDYIQSLALSRSQNAVNILEGDGVKNFSYDTIAWRKIGDANYNYAKLPIVSIRASDLSATILSAGSIVKTEANDIYYISSPKFGDKAAVTIKIETGASYLISPSEMNLAAIRSDYGDQVTISTQITAKQGLFINELMQKNTMHMDAAANILKMFADLSNRLANQI